MHQIRFDNKPQFEDFLFDLKSKCPNTYYTWISALESVRLRVKFSQDDYVNFRLTYSDSNIEWSEI